MFEGRLPSFSQYPLDAGGRGLGTVRGWSATPGNLRQRIRWTTRWRASDEPVQALSPARCAGWFTRLHRDFGAGHVMIDVHSMPVDRRAKRRAAAAEFVLGDRYGTSCVGAVSETVEKTLRLAWLYREPHKPYAGWLHYEHYGNPAAGLHAIQLEINRALYMDEAPHRAHRAFSRLAADMETLARRLSEIPLEELRPYRAAAE